MRVVDLRVRFLKTKPPVGLVPLVQQMTLVKPFLGWSSRHAASPYANSTLNRTSRRLEDSRTCRLMKFLEVTSSLMSFLE
ncbi:15685_t:CDS:2, partial [Gigaspora rosea]